MADIFSAETVIPVAVSLNTVMNILQSLVLAAYRKHQADYKGLDEKFNKECTELETRIDEKCKRLSQIEMNIQRLPTQNEIIRLYDRIEQINKDIKELSIGQGEILGQLKGITYGRRKEDN